ncbi:50S ribosomal protein L17 [Candidatus Rhabdochlamydia oedothoracis]|uniref:50S ribosomal protein L17 n=2 Tax=cellular organisms TaxID=131567 RepID=A0ABX8V411_9BACT|nr:MULTISPECIES: 50S ribosomal protein L17 [Rhabdochlamydia]KAG6559516.1 50S ribosomal protein L17 [Candidatus Rhabdochlamydia sp. W815]QYF48312.1 50S ribosomal protein L17 [Candidatus Rhabdochlamydia oedothoracis]
MRHRKHTFKIGRTASHRRCMIANMVKSLIVHGRIKTTERKASELKRHADHVVTLAKSNALANKRKIVGDLMIRYNSLTTKEARAAKAGDTSSYNIDRRVMGKLDELAKRFANRNGGFTRVLKEGYRVGDGASLCYIEYLSE